MRNIWETGLNIKDNNGNTVENPVVKPLLKTGMIVTLRDGAEYVVLLDAEIETTGQKADLLIDAKNIDYKYLDSYSDSLEWIYTKNHPQFDIVKIEKAMRPYGCINLADPYERERRTVLWERDEKNMKKKIDSEQVMPKYKKYEGAIIHLQIYDAFDGDAEFICEDKDSITVKWITVSPCYTSSVFPIEIYTKESTYKKSEISLIEKAPDMDRYSIELARARSIIEDEPIFIRYNELENESDKEESIDL